jgi:Pyruvate/2-oxoglutarate dehydrogenase complex, dihydrolipoamide acyltransferase (E2) component, and related enzymes
MARREGKILKMHPLNAMFPYIMKSRTESLIYYSAELDVENLLEYIEKKKSEGIELKFFQMFLAALVKLFKERPHLNRFVAGRRVYQRNDIKISFVAKKSASDEAEETNVSLVFNEQTSFDDVICKVKNDIKTAKSDTVKDDDALFNTIMKLPRFILRIFFGILNWLDFYFEMPRALADFDPLRCSVYVANLGSIGIEAPFHHLFEWGTCSVFIAIGRIRYTPVALEDGTLTSKKMVEIKVTLDERIADGFYFARSLELIEKYLKNPESIESL